MPGTTTSAIEVTNISAHGFWVLTEAGEFFLSFDDFPWFKDVSVGKILNVQEPASGHFYWPDLDVDLSLEIIRNPQRFPLKAKARSQ